VQKITIGTAYCINKFLGKSTKAAIDKQIKRIIVIDEFLSEKERK
jgi:hypothetical protein